MRAVIYVFTQKGQHLKATAAVRLNHFWDFFPQPYHASSYILFSRFKGGGGRGGFDQRYGGEGCVEQITSLHGYES